MPSNLKALLLDALTIPQEKWPEFVDRACGNDTAAREELEKLLGEYSHIETSGLMRAAGVPQLAIDAPQDLFVGRVGSYELGDLLGEGGMGSVFLAEQHQPIRRTVAVKLIKPGFDSREIIARFQAERQLLALLDHPNIARV